MHKFEFPLNDRTSYQKVRRGVSSRWSSNAEHDGTIKMTVREAVLQTGSWFNPDLINDTQTALLVLMMIDTCLEGRECCWTVNTGNRWALVSGFILDSSPLKGPKWTTFFICPPSILYLYKHGVSITHKHKRRSPHNSRNKGKLFLILRFLSMVIYLVGPLKSCGITESGETAEVNQTQVEKVT